MQQSPTPTLSLDSLDAFPIRRVAKSIPLDIQERWSRQGTIYFDDSEGEHQEQGEICLSVWETLYLHELEQVQVHDKNTEILLSFKDMINLHAKAIKAPALHILDQYLVYRFYRKQGWIIQSGRNYGGDYVLYRDSPHHVHSDYIIRVVFDSLSWNIIQTMTRIAIDVKKQVFFCRIQSPSDGINEEERYEDLEKYAVEVVGITGGDICQGTKASSLPPVDVLGPLQRKKTKKKGKRSQVQQLE